MRADAVAVRIPMGRFSIEQCPARGKLREVWLVDRQAPAIESYRPLTLRGYRTQQTGGQAIVPLTSPRMRLRIAELLG